jgi:hypothetical protein
VFGRHGAKHNIDAKQPQALIPGIQMSIPYAHEPSLSGWPNIPLPQIGEIDTGIIPGHAVRKKFIRLGTSHDSAYDGNQACPDDPLKLHASAHIRFKEHGW